jgi:hypothetical protein
MPVMMLAPAWHSRHSMAQRGTARQRVKLACVAGRGNWQPPQPAQQHDCSTSKHQKHQRQGFPRSQLVALTKVNGGGEAALLIRVHPAAHAVPGLQQHHISAVALQQNGGNAGQADG